MPSTLFRSRSPGAPRRVVGRRAAVIAAILASACFPPEGSTPEGPGGASGGPPGADASLPQDQLEPLPFPEPPPTSAWTRTAPATLVNERGEQVRVLQGHHTRLSVEKLLGDRALVRCTGCRTPVQGWIQRSLLMPLGTPGTEAQRVGRRTSLALFAARARASALQDAPPPGLATVPHPVETFVALLDRGFRSEDSRALAPPWGEEPGYEGPRARLVRETDGWRFHALDLGLGPTGDSPPDGEGADPS